jgi:ATP-dependent Lhr-like helicase
MQLVLHTPYGSRINKAWGLALRKRFCRQFNFELQAAATEDALLLSLGPQHSFPLADVFRYLHPATAKDVLVQALLDAPLFQTRWRWNTTVSLAVPRFRGGRKVAPQLQRMQAEDLMAAVFPDAAACLENIPGDRQIPDHPLVSQTIRDCLEEAMDFGGLSDVLTKIHAGKLQLVTRDTPEPSPLAHEILNARPYAFLDDAPLEERRTQAVIARRASDPSSAKDIGALDPQAIARVRDEARPDPRDADELHDALVVAGFLTVEEGRAIPSAFFDVLTSARRVTRAGSMWVAAERLPEMLAVHPEAAMEPAITAPAGRAAKAWSREEALVELLRGRVSIAGPTDAASLARSLSVSDADAYGAIIDLEGQGVVLRGHFTGVSDLEFCDRSLLARIHRYTLNRLRAEIEPVTVVDFTRFLFAWQHVDPSSRLTGAEGLRAVIARLDGFELPARAWERAVLPARLDRYDAAMLDMLCLAGQAGWRRLSSPSADGNGRALRVALCLREHTAAWQALRFSESTPQDALEQGLDDRSLHVLTVLRSGGASFLRDLSKAAGVDADVLTTAVAALASRGLVTSDGFAGVRALLRAMKRQPVPFDQKRDLTGRWSAPPLTAELDRDAAVEICARALLERYGVMFRRLLTRETNAPGWRELTRVYRRLEARGEIRGGRFVTGVSGEQFALPEAVERLREVRRSAPDGRLVTISAADPLNLTGVLAGDDRIRAVTSSRIVYRDGVAVAVLEGEYLRPLAPIDPVTAADVASAAAGRRMPAVSSGFLGR